MNQLKKNKTYTIEGFSNNVTLTLSKTIGGKLEIFINKNDNETFVDIYIDVENNLNKNITHSGNIKTIVI